MLERIKSELRRIGALDIAVCEDREFEPAVEDLVHVRYDQSEWHLITPQFVELLQELPEGAGAEAVRHAIEQHSHIVWHGASPRGSRDRI